MTERGEAKKESAIKLPIHILIETEIEAKRCQKDRPATPREKITSNIPHATNTSVVRK